MRARAWICAAAAAAALLLLLAGCAEVSVYSDTQEIMPVLEAYEQVRATNITSEQAQSMLEGGGIIIIDVREQNEFDAGHIPNAILMPLGDLARLAVDAISDKTQPVLVYCRSGARSATAAQMLIDMGFTAVYNLDGGILQWRGDIVTASIYNTITQAVHPDMEELTFIITSGSFYISAQTITIKRADGSLLQEISGLYSRFSVIPTFTDYNFDGYLDMRLQYCAGGSIRNEPSYFWLWDGELEQFVRNMYLQEIATFGSVYADAQYRRIISHAHAGMGGSYTGVHEYVGGGSFQERTKQ